MRLPCPPDPLTGFRYGQVNYNYRIGTTEVTNAQYTEFLNSKAASDPLALYHTIMDSDVRGGITRSGVSGSYTYATKTSMGNKPVNFVNWYDSIRFANWLNNGQGTGDTETGAYTLLGGTPTPSNTFDIIRNSSAKWWLPSENEWYKAAYHQPAAQGGDTDGYWHYPTKTNVYPTRATSTGNTIGPTQGDITNPGPNIVNFNSGAIWNLDDRPTTVGSAGPLSLSFYGTADQAGNVAEWTDAESRSSTTHSYLRGGHYSGVGISSEDRYTIYPPSRLANEFGFRVATVPEPSSAALASVACGLLLWWRKRRR